MRTISFVGCLALMACSHNWDTSQTLGSKTAEHSSVTDLSDSSDNVVVTDAKPSRFEACLNEFEGSKNARTLCEERARAAIPVSNEGTDACTENCSNEFMLPYGGGYGSGYNMYPYGGVR